MRISTSMRWLVVALSAAMLLAVAAACGSETVEVPGETVGSREGGRQDSRGSGRDRRQGGCQRGDGPRRDRRGRKKW